MTTITQERDKLAAVGLRLRRRGEWGSNFDYTTPHDVDEPAVHQFVHISTTNPGNYSSNDAHVRAIEAIALSRDFSGISYNRLILPGGMPYEGQPIGRRGAHTINTFERATCTTAGCPSRGRSLTGPNWNLNYNARAYCMARNCGDSVSAFDRDAMARCLAADRLAGFVTRTATLHGHRCCTAKECPCEPTWSHMGDIETRMKAYLVKGNVTQEEVIDVTPEEVWEHNIPDNYRDDIPTHPNGAARDAQAILQALRSQLGDLREDDITELKNLINAISVPAAPVITQEMLNIAVLNAFQSGFCS